MDHSLFLLDKISGKILALDRERSKNKDCLMGMPQKQRGSRKLRGHICV